MTDYCVEDLLKSNAKYAVVGIEQKSNVIKLFKVLISAGYRNVRFLEDLADHPSLQNKLKPPTARQILADNYDQTIEKVIGRISSPPKASMVGEHVICRLCENRIMATRYSNLSNHVRRHAVLKQYQCSHCYYQNNEQAKVRLHMQNQHSDSSSTIIDKYSLEMQQMWDRLMDECFPNHQEILQNARDSKKANDAAVEVEPNEREVNIYRCIECSAIVPCFSGDETGSSSPLEAHLSSIHRAECNPYKCDECGYQNSEQWKIRWHISLRHTSDAADITVSQSSSPNCALFVKRFFNDVDKIVPDDDEEQELHSLSRPTKKRRKIN